MFLQLCRSIRPVECSTLQAACANARSAFRAGAFSDEVFAQPRARGMLRAEEAPEASAVSPVEGEAQEHADAHAPVPAPELVAAEPSGAMIDVACYCDEHGLPTCYLRCQRRRPRHRVRSFAGPWALGRGCCRVGCCARTKAPASARAVLVLLRSFL